MKMEQSVPKRRHIKFRRRGITQKKTYSASTYSVVLVRPLHKPHKIKKKRRGGICMFLLIIYSIDSDKKKLLEFCRTDCLDFQFGRLLNVQKRMLSDATLLAMAT